MTKFNTDSPPEGFVSGVSGPTGQVGFSSALFHTLIGSGWNTWSNGYTGDVCTTGGLTHTTITLPADTGAFYFYAGARYYGFYALGTERIASITVDSTVDFAIGEFGISAADSIKPALNYVALGDLRRRQSALRSRNRR